MVGRGPIGQAIGVARRDIQRIQDAQAVLQIADACRQLSGDGRRQIAPGAPEAGAERSTGAPEAGAERSTGVPERDRAELGGMAISGTEISEGSRRPQRPRKKPRRWQGRVATQDCNQAWGGVIAADPMRLRNLRLQAKAAAVPSRGSGPGAGGALT